MDDDTPALMTYDRRVGSWRRREETVFGPVRKQVIGRPIPVVEFLPIAKAKADRLGTLWLMLDRKSVIFDAVDRTSHSLVVRFPALNFQAQKIDADDDVELIAAWLLDIADAYTLLTQRCRDDIALFCNPYVKLDVLGRLRLGFLPGAPSVYDAPPEAKTRVVAWDERSIVYMAGSLLLHLAVLDAAGRSPIRDIVLKCFEQKPSKRWQSIEDVRHALRTSLRLNVERLPRYNPRDEFLDEATGWLELREPALAKAAMQRSVTASFDAQVLVETYKGYALEIESEAPRLKKLTLALDEALPRAREALRRGDIGFAASIAHEILEGHPNHREATQILVQAHLANGKHLDALALVDRQIAAKSDAPSHYLRGKILLAAARYHEARDAFEKAFALDPSMLEAMLLRREVDRALASVRTTVGEAVAKQIEIPKTLADLRDVLLSGDATQAISALSKARYATDADAQLVLARFLAMDGQRERALDVYDGVTSGEHRFAALLGKAGTLLDLARHESALAIYDELVAEKPADADASEGRARALEKLGRIGEAAAEYRRFISLATAGSDLRVRAAQEWLDAHPL